MRTNIIRSESLMVSCDAVNGWSVVEIDGEVDAHTAPMIREVVINLLAEGHHHFVLDLNFVTFMDSMGLGVIVAITKRIREHEGSLRIASASGRILRIFDLSCGRPGTSTPPSASSVSRDTKFATRASPGSPRSSTAISMSRPLQLHGLLPGLALAGRETVGVPHTHDARR